MAFGKRGLSEYQARQQAAKTRNGSQLEAVQSLTAFMDRLVQAGDGTIGYLVERPELTGAVARFDPSTMTAAMTYCGRNGDLYPVLGHLEPAESMDLSEHVMLHALAGSIIAAQKAVAANYVGDLPDRLSPDDLERFGEPVLADIVLQAIVLKCYLAALALHVNSDSRKRAANAEPGIERELEELRRKGQADLAAAVRRWASRNMAHHDRAEAILMQAKMPTLPVATGNTAGPGSAIIHGVWIPDEMAGAIGGAG